MLKIISSLFLYNLISIKDKHFRLGTFINTLLVTQ